MTTFSHKRGDTFALACSAENAGVAVDLTNYTISSQIRDTADSVIETLTVTKTSAVDGEFTMSATATQTELWTLGSHQCDIEFVSASGEVDSTETFTISVIKDITR